MSSSLYGHPLYGVQVYGAAGLTEENLAEYLQYYIDCIPPPYRVPEHRDFWERYLSYPARDLAQMNAIFDDIHTFINAATAPVEWLDWMLHEWWGWHLIPDGYPIDRKRRLLANMHDHYKRRYTTRPNAAKTYDTLDERLADPESGAGVKLLLREFGIFAEVYDRRMSWGGFWKQHGVDDETLRARIRVFGYEAFHHPRRTTVKSFWGRRCFYHTNNNVITQDFVRALINWCRPASQRFVVEWVTLPWRPYPYREIPEGALFASGGDMLATDGGGVIGINE